MNFGERLKKLREENGITQETLANTINVRRPAISGYETKCQQPDYEKLCAIADFFDVSIDYLLGHSTSRRLISPIQSEEKQELFDLYDQLSYRNKIALQERAKILIERQEEESSQQFEKNNA